MRLIEILHTIHEENKEGLVNIDEWKWADADHLKSMGFDFTGDYVMSLPDPSISVYKKKTPTGECFFVEEKGRGKRMFNTFAQVVEYFDHYSQPEIDRERD